MRTPSKSLRAAALVVSMVLTSATLVAAGVVQDQSALSRLLTGPGDAALESTRSASNSFALIDSTGDNPSVELADPAAACLLYTSDAADE